MNYNEEWMVVVTTDHGGEGTGHGDQDDLEQTRKVWSVIRTPGATKYELTQMNSVDLVPTMLKWLGISGLTNLDGVSLN
jgi:arylsulfatase A-like enzyme